jgi:putative ABC transport system ATP-binding protein
MIQLRGVNKSYPIGTRSLHVLKDLDLDIAAGEMVAIMGSSGSGKSTLLNILGLLDGFDSGEYMLDGRSMRGLSERRGAKLRGELLGFVFQSFNLIGYKTALENVSLPLYYQSVPRRRRDTLARQYLEKVGLLEWADHLPGELSGGQKQRVAIARALISQPRVIFADEPTGALDSTTSASIMASLKGVNAEGITVVIVTHEPDIAAQADRTIRMRDGQVVSP